MVKSFENLACERNDNKYYREELTEAERQDQYHAENSNLQTASLLTGLLNTAYNIFKDQS